MILETFFIRLTISVYELGAGMGVDECSCDSFVGGCGGGAAVSSSFTVERDKGAGAALNNLLMCLGRNHGKGSRMSSGPWGITEGAVMGRGTMPPGITGSVGYCGTELGEDSQTVMIAGISVEVSGSGVIELGKFC